MYTLKRFSIRCPENEKDLFMFLYWDTEEADPSGWNEFLRKNNSYERMWMGHVDRDKMEFDVRNAQSGLFKSRVSNFRIQGKVKRGIVSKTIEVEIGFGFSLVTQVLVSIIFAAILATSVLANHADLTVLLLMGLILILLGGLHFDDFHGSENLITTYLKDPTKVSKLAVKK